MTTHQDTTRLRHIADLQHLRNDSDPDGPYAACLDYAIAALARPAPPATAGGEWVLVPREPTPEMLIAARDWSNRYYGKPIGNADATGCYTAMLAAAPTPPATAGKE